VGYYTDGGFGAKMGLANGTNLRGNEPPKMPDIMARVGLTNTYTFENEAELTSRIEYVHRGEMQARVFNNPLYDRVPSYDIVNLSFSYDNPASPLSFGLIISNAGDEDGVNNIFNNPFGVWSTSTEYIPPREVIASIKYSW
jgi:iron complex outermembrane receptor protein